MHQFIDDVPSMTFIVACFQKCCYLLFFFILLLFCFPFYYVLNLRSCFCFIFILYKDKLLNICCFRLYMYKYVAKCICTASGLHFECQVIIYESFIHDFCTRKRKKKSSNRDILMLHI